MSPSEKPKPPFDPALWNRHALLTCAEMRRAEESAVTRGSRTFFDMMQSAGRAVAQAAMDRFAPCRVLVLCGAGNNGGDGYVAAAALKKAGWPVRVAALAAPATPDARRAAMLWGGETFPLTPGLLEESDLAVDALFGTGLTRPLEGAAAEIVRALQTKQIPVVSADMPSGIDGDTGRLLGAAVSAQATVTFFRKKRGHALLPALSHCGEVLVADTGMQADVLDEIAPQIAENNEALWRALWPTPGPEGHKYDRGHALILGGGEMTGASRLAARAAQRIGAGLVTLAAPKEAWDVYARLMESVITLPLEKEKSWEDLLADPKRNALLVGPGLGLAPGGKDKVLAALAAKKPSVLDADALTLFADEPDVLLRALHASCVLTPHEGEFARLFGAKIDPKADKISRAQKAAERASCTVLLKGADTVITREDGFAVINLNAPPWLATGGAGDVLAGLILGLLAAGMPVFAAACAAAHAHGAIAASHGPGLIAEDLIEGIPAFLQKNG